MKLLLLRPCLLKLLDATVQVWNLETLQRMKTLTGHTDAVRALAVADNRLFSGSYDGTVKVWDTDELTCLQTLSGHTGPVRTLVYSGEHWPGVAAAALACRLVGAPWGAGFPQRVGTVSMFPCTWCPGGLQ